MYPWAPDISDSLAQLVAESKQQTAAGAGLSGARHAADAAATVDTKEGVREKLDALVDRVKGLRKLTAEATLFLPLYELRRAQEVLYVKNVLVWYLYFGGLLLPLQYLARPITGLWPQGRTFPKK